MYESFPQRKNPRLQGYDYAKEGMYFVTICTHERNHLFGHIDDEELHLNLIGQTAVDCWLKIPEHYPYVELDAYVVMPNHVHGIVVITGSDTTDRIYPVPTTDKKRATLSTIIGSYKAAVTRFANQNSPQQEIIWQTRFHDHIIRNEASLNHIRHYVNHNPASWEKDILWSLK